MKDIEGVGMAAKAEADALVCEKAFWGVEEVACLQNASFGGHAGGDEVVAQGVDWSGFEEEFHLAFGANRRGGGGGSAHCRSFVV